MKKKILLPVTFLSLVLSACGGNTSSSSSGSKSEPGGSSSDTPSSASSSSGPSEEERKKQSTAHVNDYYLGEELYYDQAENYMSPLEPKSTDSITVRAKCKYGQSTNVKVWVTNDKTNPTFTSYDMKFEIADVNLAYEYWIGTIPAQSQVAYYHFSFGNNKETVYFNREGLAEDQFTTIGGDWTIYPDFTTPDWSKGTVWYSAMPDSFSNGNTLNDKKGQHGDAWGNYHNSGNQYFGGDLQGLNDKIEYIKNLGATSLFINPIWNTTHQAGYGSFDFKQIDSCFGNEETMHALIDELHANDMQIMLDAVFEYCNVSNIYYNTSKLYPGLYGEPASDPANELYDFVQRDAAGNVIYSTWGSPLIDFSSDITRDILYKNTDSVMQYYIREFDIDGWRMDVGNSLRGTDPDYYGTSTQILTDMRNTLKPIDNDFFFLSEHANGDQFNYCLDSKWNYAFGYAIRDWGKGVSNPMVLLNTIEQGVLGLPRSVANASYNFLTTHDLNRFYDIANPGKFNNADRTSVFNAANILQFTFVGSPSIFYGEETGMPGNHAVNDTIASPFFNSMNWFEEDWNYDIYNKTQALGKLRNSYERLFKDGAYIRLYSKTGNENPNGLMSFGRFNKEGHAITVVNPTNNIQKDFTIDVGLMDIKNGTIMYDLFSGKSYVVKDGKITADVYSGGIVLVDKKISSGFIGGFNSALIGNASNEVTLGEGSATFNLQGGGTIADKADAIGFTYRKGFNNYKISANVSSPGGTSALLVRGSLDPAAPFVGVKFTNGNARVFYRDVVGGDVAFDKSITVGAADVVSIARESNNECVIYVNNEAKARLNVYLPYEIYLGFASLAGNGEMSNVQVTALDKELYNHFETNLGSMVYADGDYELASSILTLKGTAENPSRVVMPYAVTDFSVKTSMDFAPVAGQYAGITIGRDNDFVFLGKMDSNENIVLAHVVNGEVSIIGTTPYTSNNAVLQLEKVGYNIYGYVKQGNTNTCVGKTQENYSELAVTLLSNNSAAKFDYISLGDSVNGVVSTADFCGEKDVDFGLYSYGSAMKYANSTGTWEFSDGGIRQTDIEASESRYSYTAISLENFNASFALKTNFKDASSYVGVLFGTSTSSSSTGFAMKLFKDGTVKFFDRDDEEIGNYKIENFEEGKDYSFYIQNENGIASFYVGDDPKLMFTADGFSYEGFFSFIGSYATYEIKTYGIYNDNSNYKIQSGIFNKYSNDKKPQYYDLEVVSSSTTPAYVSLIDTKVSNFVFGANVQMNRSNKITRAYTRLYIGNRFGGNSINEGLVVQINDLGKLCIYEDGILKVEDVSLGDINTESFYLVLAYQGTELNIYVAPYKESEKYSFDDLVLAYTYEDSYHRSGVFSLYSQNASVRFGMIRCESITANQDYTKSSIMNYYYVEEPLPGEPEVNPGFYEEEYRNDFSERQSIGDFSRYSGSVSVKGGVMIIDGTSGSNWDAGAGLAVGQFDNYKLTCRVKNTNAYGWSAIEFNKSAVNVNHQQTSLTLLITKLSAELYLGNDIYYTDDSGSRVEINIVPDEDGYVPVTIICNNGKLSINCGNPNSTLVVNIEDLERNNNLVSGYISLNSGSNLIYFDDLVVTPGVFPIEDPIKGNKELLKEQYSNDFSDDSKASDFICYNGSVGVEDGAYYLDAGETENWKAGTLFKVASLENFDMDIDVKVLENWAAIELFKTTETASHEGEAITVMVATDFVRLYLGEGNYQDDCEIATVFNDSGFASLHIQVRDGVLTVKCGDSSFSVELKDLVRNSHLSRGFLSLNCGNTKVWFDNIVIKP